MKKIFLITLKKKSILIVFAFIVTICAVFTFATVKSSAMPKPQYSIVIDAGHGGKDGGAVGKTTGITESELNLKYAKTLQDLCEDFGIGVTMTRSDMNGLYDETASNKKKSEMEKRRSIINNSGADLMVSLHMNSYPLSSCEGAQIFYAKGSELGFKLAKSVQTSVCLSFEKARKYVSVGDYFVLNYSNIPSILIECGFLSNPHEEKNLINDDYCEKFCYNILAGILSYFEI